MHVILDKIPSLVDLERAYEDFLKIKFQPDCTEDWRVLDIKKFVQYCQWTRFDSRLGEICVHYFAQHWMHIHPIELNQAIKKQPWPATLGVLLEFAQIEFSSTHTQKTLQFFHLWHQVAVHDLPKAHWEQFFIGKRRIAGKAMWDDVRLSLEEYKKWGYFSREVLIHKNNPPKPSELNTKGGSYSSHTRSQILQDLLQKQQRVTTFDYWIALGQRISKRQAERDLLASTKLRPVGNTKSRYFVKKKLNQS